MVIEVLEKIDRARVMVAQLNYGEREWKLNHPPRDDDPDVVIHEALRSAALEISRLTRELEAARERERHIEGQIVALVEAEVISEGKAREILGIGVEEWREIEDSRALATDTEVSDEA